MPLTNLAYDYRDEPTDLDLVPVLSNHYGDGTVFVPERNGRPFRPLAGVGAEVGKGG